MRSDIEISAEDHAAVVARYLSEARSPKELLACLLDLSDCRKGVDDFFRVLGSSDFDYPSVWCERVMKAMVTCADRMIRQGKLPMRSEYVKPPLVGTMWDCSDGKSILVIATRPPGLVYCAPQHEGRWKIERLRVFSSADFLNFGRFTIRAPSELKEEPTTSESPEVGAPA